MSEIIIREITESTSDDINIKNERFKKFGKMIPSYQNGKWDYTVSENEGESWDCFPDENYSFEKMAKDHVFLGACDGSVCVGLAILRHQWHKYLYLYDLKVNSAYRGQHIATDLISESFKYALANGYRGLWTIAQDNNLAACLSYINNGFRIGGFDTEVYNGTSLEGSADIYFYKDV